MNLLSDGTSLTGLLDFESDQAGGIIARFGPSRPRCRPRAGPGTWPRRPANPSTSTQVGQLALDWGRENLKPQFRGDEADGHAFGTEIPVAEDALLYYRLAGFFGRDPR